MIFLRPQRTVVQPSPTDPNIIRSKLSGLCRFAKAQLTQLAASDESREQILADIARYEKYMSNPASFLKNASDDIQLQADMLLKLDRYPEVPIGRLHDYAEVLEKKMKNAFAILEQQPKQNLTVEKEYWDTSKFRILTIHKGVIACMPDGDVPPGAIELLVGQVIDTKVDGEEVYIEIENVQEGKMMLWFKPDIMVPKTAEVVWSYAYEPTAVSKNGTKWLTQENVVVVSPPEQQLVPVEGTEIGEWAVEVVQSEPAFDPPKFYPPRKVVDPYKPLVEKMKALTSAETAEAYKQALLDYGNHFDLDAEYASHYDREVVEAKRDRYLNALVAAQTAPLSAINPISVSIEYAVTKGELIDKLRVAETRVAEYQLQARLHERILAGEPVTEEEKLEYRPHERDEMELDRDYGDDSIGRYIWVLNPQMEGNPDCLIQDLRYKDLPPVVNSVAKVLAEYEKTTALLKKAERAACAKLFATLAVRKMHEDKASGKFWPGQEASA
jgi:hypothetical protein